MPGLLWATTRQHCSVCGEKNGARRNGQIIRETCSSNSGSRPKRSTDIGTSAQPERLSRTSKVILAHSSGEWISSEWPVCQITDTKTQFIFASPTFGNHRSTQQNPRRSYLAYAWASYRIILSTGLV